MTEIQFEESLAAMATSHSDSRGWFKGSWQRVKMMELDIPDFKAVQNGVSLDAGQGVTRGIHAEPWDRSISVATGSDDCTDFDAAKSWASVARAFFEVDNGEALGFHMPDWEQGLRGYLTSNLADNGSNF